jgi:glycine C-acetyltransferase
MEDLREKLDQASDARIRLIATDGVFSMDGTIVYLRSICDLAQEHNALVMVDDSHAVGFMGASGAGTPEYCGVSGRVDIMTGTFGKALGGASGGYVSGRKVIIDLLRQKSRPYLFSNTLAPSIAAGTLKVLELLKSGVERRKKLFANVEYYTKALEAIGLDIINGGSPIIPIMLYDEQKALKLADRLMQEGIYVTAFIYPVVPKGKARIRTQISAAHSISDIDFVIEKLKAVKQEMSI